MTDVEGKAESIGSVTSDDGTAIGYRRIGEGPALVLLHGAMQSSSSFSSLARLLAPAFTVYTPDRRGRGNSGPIGAAYGLDRECEDLLALLRHAGASRVFGLSAGALVALRTAQRDSTIQRLVLYEPPLIVPGATAPTAWGDRYRRDLAAGDLAAAMASVIKGTGDSGLFEVLPRLILVPLLRRGIAAETVAAGRASIRELIPTVRNDLELPGQMPPIASFAGLGTDLLLLGGDRSQPYLKAALDALHETLPQAERQLFRGVGHIAADNVGKPALVADSLLRFFAEPGLSP